MSRKALLKKILEYCSYNENDPIYQAFFSIPRENFVPEEESAYAYLDTPLPIGFEQTVSQPTMIYLMLKELELRPEDKVLEIGTGSGYNAALMSQVAAEVHTIERIPELALKAEKTIKGLGIKNVHFYTGDGTLGFPEKAPYDKIIVTAGAPEIPEELKNQLGIQGLLVIPVGNLYLQQLTKIRKKEVNQFIESSHGGCMFVKLIGKKGWPESEDDIDETP